MAKMRAFQVKSPNGPLEFVEKDIPEPGPGQVRIRVKACGICHSDTFVKEGLFPNIPYPRVPGHEVAGVVDALGVDVPQWKTGQRVGIGWHGGQCGYCNSCQKGDFNTCQINHQVTGISFNGGYADYMIAPKEALALIPTEISFVDAAPLMCAGITTFNALRNSCAKAGDLVAILGVGGLGHLGIQFSAKMGFRTVAIARGNDKEELAKKLGAWQYINSQEKNMADELKKLGGAQVVLATVTHGPTMSASIGGLGVNGKLILLGVAQDPIEVSPLALIGDRKSVVGWPSGAAIDSQETLNFCAMANVRSMNEVFPLERAPEAYDRMMSGNARFRVVLKMED